MGPVSAEIDIDASRAEAFEAIADLARRPSFTDHLMTGFHLTRMEAAGVGAGARFRIGPRRRAIWMDTAIEEVEAPHRLVEHGRGGRSNRIPATTVWELLEGPGGITRVRVSHWTEPASPVDRLLEVVSGCAGWHQRHWREALRRLRDQLESNRPGTAPVEVAAGNRHETGIP